MKIPAKIDIIRPINGAYISAIGSGTEEVISLIIFSISALINPVFE